VLYNYLANFSKIHFPIRAILIFNSFLLIIFKGVISFLVFHFFSLNLINVKVLSWPFVIIDKEIENNSII